MTETLPAFQEAKTLLAKAIDGALGTMEENRPYVSATGFLYDDSESEKGLGKVYYLMSDLARHTRNLRKNPEASLLVVEAEVSLSIHERKRLTALGTVEAVLGRENHESLKGRYMKVFPRSEIFFGLADFHFYSMPLREIHWYGGFGKAEVLK
ncbi:MAG: pyridoxamine 5'-phosphate oxidase family protein [Candidatus Omnitrophota bacterium]|nr:pyridoxamine 5'-phosphate oxidase family protein [Candidatus Omnitrophota bacterium]